MAKTGSAHRRILDSVLRWLENAHTVRKDGRIVGHVIYLQGRGVIVTLLDKDLELEVPPLGQAPEKNQNV